MAVAVRVINIFGTKGNHFSTLGDVTKMSVLSHLYERELKFCLQRFKTLEFNSAARILIQSIIPRLFQFKQEIKTLGLHEDNF